VLRAAPARQPSSSMTSGRRDGRLLRQPAWAPREQPAGRGQVRPPEPLRPTPGQPASPVRSWPTNASVVPSPAPSSTKVGG
jgi:hypothetical protein